MLASKLDDNAVELARVDTSFGRSSLKDEEARIKLQVSVPMRGCQQVSRESGGRRQSKLRTASRGVLPRRVFWDH